MTEPHVFCGPEFVLEITRGGGDAVADSGDSHRDDVHHISRTASNRGSIVSSSLLLQLQTAIYGVCTVRTRQRIPRQPRTSEASPYAATAMTGATAAMPLSAAPSQVTFVEVKLATELNSEEQASLQYSLKALHQRQQQQSPTAVPASTTGGAAAAVTYVLLLATDSRVAAEVYMLALQHGSIALTHGCRLYNYYRATARAASLDLTDLLKKRHALRARYNMDADMWSALQERLTDQFMQSWDERVSRLVDSSSPVPGHVRLLTLAEEHERNVKKLLRYCEHEVQYAGILDENEEASPFLLAMGLFYRLGLTLNDLTQYHFTRHPRRVVRALAMFIARYTAAPEELLPFFAPSLHDAVVIACSADSSVTCSMQSLSQDLLRKDEVNEAWLPVLHKYWHDHVIEPALAQAQAQDKPTPPPPTAATEPTSSTCTAAAVTHRDASGDGRAPTVADDAVRAAAGPVGKGRGVAGMFGFRSLHVLAEHVRAQERGLQPARMSSLLAHKRVVGGGGGSLLRSQRSGFASGDEADPIDATDDRDELDDDSGDEEEDGFLIHVHVQAKRDETQTGVDGSAGGMPSGELPGVLTRIATTAMHAGMAGVDGSEGGYRKHSRDERDAAGAVASKRAKAGEDGSRNRRTESAHVMAMRKGQTLLLSLLGRTQPFDAKDDHYIEF